MTSKETDGIGLHFHSFHVLSHESVSLWVCLCVGLKDRVWGFYDEATIESTNYGEGILSGELGWAFWEGLVLEVCPVFFLSF